MRDIKAKVRYIHGTEGTAGLYRRIRGKFSRLSDPTPVTLPTQPVGDADRSVWPDSVVILANQSLPQCFHYRVRQKQFLLEQLAIPCVVVDPEDAAGAVSAVQLASLVIVFRLPLIPGVRRAIDEAHRLGVRVVFEADDAVYRRDLLEHNPNVRGLPKHVQRAVIAGADHYLETMLAADACLASTRHSQMTWRGCRASLRSSSRMGSTRRCRRSRPALRPIPAPVFGKVFGSPTARGRPPTTRISNWPRLDCCR